MCSKDVISCTCAMWWFTSMILLSSQSSQQLGSFCHRIFFHRWTLSVVIILLLNQVIAHPQSYTWTNQLGFTWMRWVDELLQYCIEGAHFSWDIAPARPAGSNPTAQSVPLPARIALTPFGSGAPQLQIVSAVTKLIPNINRQLVGVVRNSF